jgi:hypothetical protein
VQELSVTDVQKALRKYAEYGHDVISSPHEVLLEGNPYRMALGHRLDLGAAGVSNPTPDHWLSSYITQAERPLISNIQTAGVTSTGNFNSIDSAVIGNVHYLTPTFGVKGGSLYRSPHNYLRTNLGEPGVATGKHEDFHEAMKAHTTGDVEAAMPKGFNHEEALMELLGHNRPYSGLVTVHHHRVDPDTYKYVGTSRHIYDPSTEKLFSVPGR